MNIQYHHRAVPGFTLVELLTVIAIIGILAAIIIPTVGKVREKARAAQCVSNHRQLAQALILYASDHRSKFPPMADKEPGDPVVTGTWWTNRLVDGGYAPEGKWRDRPNGAIISGIFVCPLVQNPSWYGGIAIAATVADYKKSLSLDRITDPSRIPLVGDAPVLIKPDGAHSARPQLTNYRWWGEDYRLNRHSGGGYIAFVDGHVKLYSETDLLNPDNKVNILPNLDASTWYDK
ncbi:prepilin-type N-terminal cleavage/methylation domain-containing protein [Opitutaceae bacterium TAV1]|nr:prepilin-type N-terminal cleavage/methylation domain-containing protein [Opitutaceae bacterium TAV1]